jgi:hypothetical protein
MVRRRVARELENKDATGDQGNDENGDYTSSCRQKDDIVNWKPFYEVKDDTDVDFSGDEDKDTTGDDAQ